MDFVKTARKVWARACLPFLACKELFVGKGFQLAVSSRLRAGKNAVIRLGDNSNLAGNITVFGGLFVGKNVFVAPGSKIWVCENAALSIGDFSKIMGSEILVRKKIVLGKASLLSPETMLHDNNGHSTVAKKRKKWIVDPGYPRPWNVDDNAIEFPIQGKPIVFGENVWLGRRCIVLKGVRIGGNSVVGAGSVVTKSIPANCIAVGNPAKVIKRLS